VSRALTEPLVSGASPETLRKMLGMEAGEVSQACGTVGLVSQPLARYTDFWLSFQALVRPASTKFVFRQGMDVTGNYNGLVEDMSGDWLWIMGDDHTFAPDILLNLLAHDVDVVVPLCLKKDAPFDPVVYEGQEEREDGLIYHHVARLPESGMVEVHAAGSAGMLIRKHVLDAIDRPVFVTEKGMQNEDLVFCRRVREAGFRIFCDVDQRMGHISPKTVYPMWQGNRYGAIMEIGNGQFSPVYTFTEDELEAMEAEALEPTA
jgi:hypothetical protein